VLRVGSGQRDTPHSFARQTNIVPHPGWSVDHRGGVGQRVDRKVIAHFNCPTINHPQRCLIPKRGQFMRTFLRVIREARHNLRGSPGLTATVAKIGEPCRSTSASGSILLSVLHLHPGFIRRTLYVHRLSSISLKRRGDARDLCMGS
jgi:hypothetical protein